MMRSKALLGLLVACVAVLVGCAPFQQVATNTLNGQLGDDASLTFVLEPEAGLLFDPGDDITTDTIIDILYDSITTIDEDLCEVDGNGHVCDLGAVPSPVFIRISGTNVTAAGSWRRFGSGRLYTEFATR